MSKKSIFLFLSVFLAFPVLAFAQPTIGGMVDGAVRTAMYIVSGIVVIMWLVTGYLFLAGATSPEKIVAGKKALFAAVAGTLLVIVANSAIYIVGQAFNL